MDPTLILSFLAVLAGLLVAPLLARALRRRTIRRARTDPSLDPAARRVGAHDRALVAAVLSPRPKPRLEGDPLRALDRAGPDPDALIQLAGALTGAPLDPRVAAVRAGIVLRAAEVGDLLWWRAPLREADASLAASLAHSPADPDLRRASAHLALALGELKRATDLLDGLPIDDWRTCIVRSDRYALLDDTSRAASAAAAAVEFAPEADRATAWAKVARVAFGTGDVADAMKAVEAALHLDADHGEALALLGRYGAGRSD